jgi:hypothetical protein
VRARTAELLTVLAVGLVIALLAGVSAVALLRAGSARATDVPPTALDAFARTDRPDAGGSGGATAAVGELGLPIAPTSAGLQGSGAGLTPLPTLDASDAAGVSTDPAEGSSAGESTGRRPGSPTAAADDSPASADAAPLTSQPAAGAPPAAGTSGSRAGAGGCDVVGATSDLGFDPFYGQVCWALGIPVVGSGAVDPAALQAAARTVSAVLGPRPDLAGRLVEQGMKVAVLGVHERAVELPEYRDLPVRFPATDWDAARAYSATPSRPLLSAPEENLTCSSVDTYPGQQVLVHELGHSVMDLAVRAADPDAWDRVQRAYARATGSGQWVGYYGGTSAAEYWAEGVQAYFDASNPSSGPDPVGSPVGSRDELAAYDPGLYTLVRGVFGDNPWRASCP